MTIDEKIEELAPGDAANTTPVFTPEAVIAADPPQQENTKPQQLRELRNCITDHVVVKAGGRTLRVSPLGSIDVDNETISTFALASLADDHVVRVAEPCKAAGTAESGSAFGFIFLAVIAYFVALNIIDSNTAKMVFSVAAPCVVALGVVVYFAVTKKRLAVLGRGMSLVVVFILAVGVPGCVALAFGDVSDMATGPASAELFGRLAQTLLIVLAALVPTVLYYIFDRQRAATIRHNFQQQILRLDPDLETLYDVEAKYGDLLLEAVGLDSSQRSRGRESNPYPILIAGALIVLGWLLVLPVVDDASGVADSAAISAYLVPRHTTYVFGFLGAYFFAINLIARRYVRGDLRPKAYGAITVRILTVFILSWVLEVAFAPADWIYVAAFMIGIVPETFFTLISESQRAVLGKLSDAMREPHPLTKLEGIDLYDRSRLQDEGVNNVEALAHHDLVELMLATRIPVPRLVDWVDQAILYLHTVDEDGKGLGRDHLRACGIRTASDLLTISKDSNLWNAVLESDPVQPSGRLNLVAKAIVDDEWMTDILTWRKAQEPTVREFVVVDGQLITSH